MTAPVVSAAYLPSVQYFRLIAAAQTVQIEAHEHFAKQTCHSRCHILGANGILRLTIPIVKNHGSKTPIRSAQIDYSVRWQQQHWRALTAAYGKSPFFAHYADTLRPFYERRERFLFDLNYQLLCRVAGWLGLEAQMSPTDAYTPASPICEDAPVPYYQRFAERFGFVPNLSAVDLLFNEGGSAAEYLMGGGSA